MFKYLLLTILLLLTYSDLKSEDCFCETDSIYNNYIDCEPDILDNGAMIYWSFNCDSSWLTFKYKEHRILLESFDKDWMNYTGRLGYVSHQEFKNSILFESKPSSGSVRYREYILHDKTKGEVIKELGTGVYTASDPKYPFFISLNLLEEINEFVIFNINTLKEYKLTIPKEIIDKSVESQNFLYEEDVFYDYEFKEDTIFIKYRLNKSEIENPKHVIKIDLKQYR